MLNPKKKYAEKLLAIIQTNEKGEATYNGITLESSAGIIKADSLKNAHISCEHS